MPTVVVPFRGAEGKSRLARLPLEARAALARAMLADVLAACTAVGRTYVVAPEGTNYARCDPRPRSRGGREPRQAGLDAAAPATAGSRTSSSTPTSRA